MIRQRKYIPLPERLAAVLADLLPAEQRDDLRRRQVSAWVVIRKFTPDHNVLHSLGGSDCWWNLTMRPRGDELKAKDISDLKLAAKIKRLRGETCTKPTRDIPSRPFPKRQGAVWRG